MSRYRRIGGNSATNNTTAGSDEHWDIDRYKDEHECEEHWELRKAFLETWKYNYPEERLICLARIFTNIELLGCRYPAPVMREVARLSVEVGRKYREQKKSKLQKTFVSASVTAKDRARGIKRVGGEIVEDKPKYTKIGFVPQGQVVDVSDEETNIMDNRPTITVAGVKSVKTDDDSKQHSVLDGGSAFVKPPSDVCDSAAVKTDGSDKLGGSQVLGETGAGPSTSMWSTSSEVRHTNDDVFASWQIMSFNKGKGNGPQNPTTKPLGVAPPAGAAGVEKAGKRRKKRRKQSCLQACAAVASPTQVSVAAPDKPASNHLPFSAGAALPADAQEKGLAKRNKSANRPGQNARVKAKRALDDPTSPRGEHKRPRLGDSNRTGNVPYAQAKDQAKSPLFVAVTCARTGLMTKDLADKVLADIQKRIISESWSSPKDLNGPAFYGKPMYADGVLKLWCSNDHTLSWLKGAVADLTLPSGISLTVRSQSEIQQRVRCGILIPDEQGVLVDSRDIGRMLAYQNDWLEIKNWTLYKALKQAGGWFVVVGVPEDQIPTLMKKGRRLQFGLGTVYAKFRGLNGKFVDVPLGWDHTTATL